MSANAIILHGTTDDKEYYDSTHPSLSNSHWLPWLQKQLLINEITAATPEVPRAYELNWQVWKKEIERFEITEETALIGHSCGGGFWVRWLSDNPNIKVGNVVLVAPWIDPDNSKNSDFFKFKIDKNLTARTKKLIIFHSSNDMPSVQKTVAQLREGIEGIEYKEFNSYGHFTYGAMKTEEFPELLEEVLK